MAGEVEHSLKISAPPVLQFVIEGVSKIWWRGIGQTNLGDLQQVHFFVVLKGGHY